ncbi:MAG: hypothetical protein PHZ07_04375 [Patescibacteria group bacterium]|nr:hypothetical protein [Patescibacteria group bacterium]MDD4303984.1 hypothetical protein [Patescibacteria group bacterium]MDD4695027.1 hypothetical protein [Patescibacteria group bacterium]
MIKQTKKIFQNFSNKWFGFSKKRRTFLTISFCLIFLLFISPFFVKADNLGSAIGQILTNVVLFFVDLASTLVILEMKVMVYLAQWRSFTKGVFAVEEGWKIVRDLCNMFFILILLVISFSTILKIESYAYKKWLAKLVVFAIIINFSKTITGILIDFSQVIMLTFVSSFQAATAGNLAQGLHLGEFLKADSSGNIAESDSWTMFGAAVLALILMAIFGIVMLIMIVMLMGRIVTLWVLTILSPIAYLLQASPIGTKYANQWWEEFSKNLISGPVLAFFLWLALFTIQNASDKQLLTTLNEQGSAEIPDDDNNKLAGQGVGAGPGSATGTQVGKASVLLDYIVVIALLIAAIKVAQSMGVMGSQFAGSMMSNMNSFAGKAARFAVKTPLKGAAGLASWADRKTLSKWGVGYHSAKMGIEGIKASFADKKDQDMKDIRTNAASRTGLSGVLFGAARGKEWGNRYLAGTLGLKGLSSAVGDTFHGAGYTNKESDELDKAGKEKERLEGLRENIGSMAFGKEEQDKMRETKDEEIEEEEKKKTELMDGKTKEELEANVEEAKAKAKAAKTDEEKKSADDELKKAQDKLDELEAIEDKIKKLAEEKESIKLFDIESDDFEAFSKIQHEQEIKRINSDQTLTSKERSEQIKDAKSDYEIRMDRFHGLKANQEKEEEDITVKYNAAMTAVAENPGLTDDEAERQRKELEEQKSKEISDSKNKVASFVIKKMSSSVTSENFVENANEEYQEEDLRIQNDKNLSEKQKDKKRRHLAEHHNRKLKRYSEFKDNQEGEQELKELDINSEYDERVKTVESDRTLSDDEQRVRINNLNRERRDKIDESRVESKLNIDNFVGKMSGAISKDDYKKSIDERIQAKESEMTEHKENISKYTMVSTTARSAHRELVDKKAKEISGLQSQTELISAFRSAMNAGDQYTGLAVVEKLAKDGNLNELLNEFNYDSNAIGQTKFFEEKFGGDFGMKKQEYLAAQNDVSYAAEKAGHWEQARTVKVRPDGKFECMVRQNEDGSWDDSEHAFECWADIMKLDPQVIARTLNRLAFGGENGKTKKFEMSALGGMLVKSLGANSEFITRHAQRMNINLATNLVNSDKTKSLAGDKFYEALLKLTTQTSGKTLSPEDIYNEVMKIFKNKT